MVYYYSKKLSPICLTFQYSGYTFINESFINTGPLFAETRVCRILEGELNSQQKTVANHSIIIIITAELDISQFVINDFLTTEHRMNLLLFLNKSLIL